MTQMDSQDFGDIKIHVFIHPEVRLDNRTTFKIILHFNSNELS